MRGDASEGTDGRMSRDEALALVRRLLDDTGDTGEGEADEILDALERGLGCPHISDYVYWPLPGSDPTPEEIVDRALAYRPIAL
ncbi:e9imm peptide [Streptomyces sp. SID4931]|nr:e9imm peptide [Streptomyces sp. SID4931]SCG08730.1 Colicin immunity protein / pyocin immunity protein [Streptomyces sp. Ncost-T6T-2b]